MKIADVKIGKRVRQNIKRQIDELVNSIMEVGLLHPIIVNSNNDLIAGRRIEAAQRLGWSDIT